MSNPNMVPMGAGAIGSGYPPANQATDPEMEVRKHLAAHVNHLTEEITALEAMVKSLTGLHAQLERAANALAAFNASHPGAPVELFGCTTCERTFSTQRGLSRHARVHKPPTALDVLDP